jgi:GH18 family chitinase
MRRGLSVILSGLTAAAFLLGAASADAVRGRHEVRIAGYLPEYRLAQVDVESLGGLTDLILFSAEPNADGSLNMTRLESAPWEKLLTYKTKHRVRLLLAVGGWERSTHFAAVAASDQARQRFIRGVLQTALAKRLDGIDIDWEHPRTAAEEESYGQLLAGLRSAFGPHGLQLTVTIGSWQRLPPAAIEAVDAVQVMSYDKEGEHATEDAARKDVQALLDAGIPPGKIVLGVPFYGRHVETREAKAYRNLVAEFSPAPETDRIGEVYFNGPVTLRRKVDFAVEAGLGGVMIWELGHDAPGEKSLLRAVREAVSRWNR